MLIVANVALGRWTCINQIVCGEAVSSCRETLLAFRGEPGCSASDPFRYFMGSEIDMRGFGTSAIDDEDQNPEPNQDVKYAFQVN